MLSGEFEAMRLRELALATSLAFPVCHYSFGAEATMSQDSFHASYEVGADGKSKIVVVGTVTEHGDDETTLVRAEPQGINPRMLMLKISIKPGPGPFHPHIVYDKEIRYEEPAEKGAFTEVHIESKDGDFTLKV